MKKNIFNKKVFETEEGSISYEISGQGPCIVFIHGYMETKEIWFDFALEFTKTYKVIIIDLPGHGESSLKSAINSMDIMATVISQILVNNNIYNAVFIGHSMGGYVALAILENYPSLVRALVLLNSISTIDNYRKRRDRLKEIDLIEKGKNELLIRFAIPNSYLPSLRKQFEKQIAETINRAMKISSKNLIANIKGINGRPDRTNVLLSSRVPYIMIHGENDILFSSEDIEQNLNLHKSSFLFVSNSAHVSFIENEKEVQNIVHRFMDRIM